MEFCNVQFFFRKIRISGIKLTSLNLVTFLFIMLFPYLANASFAFSPTRVVYPSDKREKSYKIKNVGDYPTVIQAWIDDGTEGISPDRAEFPFVVLPAVFKLGPDESRSLRIIYSKEKLAEDRETLFWLNLYEIPPITKKAIEETNKISVAVKTQVKLFFRPKQIGEPGKDFEKKIQFNLIANAGSVALKLTNPTPFYITATEINLIAGNRMQNLDTLFVAPFSSEWVEITNYDQVKEMKLQLKYGIIIDNGELLFHQIFLN